MIAAIEAALIHGQAQPWMYEVLAISMQIKGRPQEDIERVLLSRMDFTATDVDSMLLSAAYLTRFGAKAPALRIYRQASSLAPARTEPYVLGLKLARETKDYNAVGWACAGILTTAWTRDRAQLHKLAEDAALEAREALLQSARHEEAAALDAALREARKRDLVVRLTWSGDGDLDLIVEEPPGTICSFELPQTAAGGVLVHDGFGPSQANCFEHYVCAFAAPGNYRVKVRHVKGNIVGKRAMLEVTRYLGTEEESIQKFAVEISQNDAQVLVALPQGRRTELAAVPRRTVTRMPSQPKRRPTLMQMIGGELDRESRLAARSFNQSRETTLGDPAAVGYTPVISVLSEGVTLNALAVISADRRYVRITAAPFFSTLTDLFTFSAVNNGGNPTGNPGVGGAGGGMGGGGGFGGPGFGGP